jgi:hypothetical protein
MNEDIHARFEGNESEAKEEPAKDRLRRIRLLCGKYKGAGWLKALTKEGRRDREKEEKKHGTTFDVEFAARYNPVGL